MHHQDRRKWGRWLRVQGVPNAHIAALLGCDLETIERDARISRGPVPAESTSPPCAMPTSPQSRSILGQTGRHVRTLHELGYGRARIAVLLALDVKAVRSFLERLRVSRRGRKDPDRLVRPRSRPEACALARSAKRARLRRRAREQERAIATAWGPRDAKGEAAAFQASKLLSVELVAALAVVEIASTAAAIPAAPPSSWAGPTSGHAVGMAHGSAKLTDDDVRAIRAAHAGGQSIYSLARDYDVAKGTIRAIVRRETWTHL
jgi:hypothetical protein